MSETVKNKEIDIEDIHGGEYAELSYTCKCCKKLITVTQDDDLDNISDRLVFYSGSYFHPDCFITYCDKQIALFERMKNNIGSAKNRTIKNVKAAMYKDKIYRFIQVHYHAEQGDITARVWKRLAEIQSGKLDNLDSGIPLEHLLDMWQKQMSKLDSIANTNKTKGKKFTIETRLLYDLSVLVNKYPSYLAWIERQKIQEVEIEDDKSIVKVNNAMNVMAKNRVKNNDSEHDANFSEYVDSIFGG